MLRQRKLVTMLIPTLLLVTAIQGTSQTAQEAKPATVSYNGRNYLVEPSQNGVTLRVKLEGSPRILGIIDIRRDRVTSLNPENYDTLKAVYQAYKNNGNISAAPERSLPAPRNSPSPQSAPSTPPEIPGPEERPRRATITADQMNGDPCALLTQAQIASAIGVPVLPGRREKSRIPSCSWSNRESTGGVGLTFLTVPQIFERKHIPVIGVGDDAIYQGPEGTNGWNMTGLSRNRSVSMSLAVKQGTKEYTLTLNGNGMSEGQIKTALASLAKDVLNATPDSGPNASIPSPTGTGPKLSVLDRPGIEGLGSATVRLDLFRFKYVPALLDSKGGMQYFIMLNNCSAPPGQFEKAFKSEFDYPKIADFYRAKAPEILSDMAGDFTVSVSQFPDVNSPFKSASPIGMVLGDYDPSKKAFPFVNAQNTKKLTVTVDNYTVPFADRAPTCSGVRGAFDGAEYMFTFNKITLTELAMDEAAARAFVAGPRIGAAGHRGVSLLLELELLPQAPQFSKDEGKMGAGVWKFATRVKKATVIDQNKQPLAKVYP